MQFQIFCVFQNGKEMNEDMLKKSNLKHIHKILIVTTVLLTALTWYLIFQIPRGLEKQKLLVAFLNVGQGDSVYIESRRGGSLLVDSGPPTNRGRGELNNIKSMFDKSLTAFLATHSDSDHVGGFVDFLRTYTPEIFFETGYSGHTGIYNLLTEEIRKKQITNFILRSGVTLQLDQDTRVKALYPDSNYILEKYSACEIKITKTKKASTSSIKNKKTNSASTKRISQTKTKIKHTKSKIKTTQDKAESSLCLKVFDVDTNDMSIVLHISYKNISFLLTGDAPIEVEEYILKKYPTLNQINVLKLGHHGSKNSSSEKFLSRLSPDYAIVSAGANNKYGHPHQEVLDRVDKNTNAKILRTDLLGKSIIFETDGYTLSQSLR